MSVAVHPTTNAPASTPHVAAKAAFRPCVIAPTFNNQDTVIDVVTRIVAQGAPLIVVNDGSTDATPSLLESWRNTPPGLDAIVLTHPRNRGKSSAMHTGFAHAKSLGYTHAVTIDTDGQLDPEQIPQLLVVAFAHPDAFVIGTRDITRPDYPAKSRFGRRVSNLLIWTESGVDVSDSQCGFRVYPMVLLERVKCTTGRFSFESEVIVRAGWAKIPIVETPVVCRYFAGNKRVTHFKPLRDSMRVLAMHAWLLTIAIMPWSPAAGPVISLADLKGTQSERASLIRRIWNWISPFRLWRQVRESSTGREKTAAALAVGAYIGNTPPWGIQALIAIYVARRWHLHPLAVILGTNVAMPPVGLALIFASVWIGHLITHGQMLQAADFSPSMVKWDVLTVRLLVDWAVGSVPVGLICAVIVFFVSMRVLRGVPASTKSSN